MYAVTLNRLPLIGLGSFALGMMMLCLLSSASRGTFGLLQPVGMIVGIFMLVWGVLCLLLYLIFSLMRDHESWKRRLTSEADRPGAQ